MFRHSFSQLNLPLPLLITGISGVAGYNALVYFRQRYPGQVVGIRQPDNRRLYGPQIEACDAEDRAALERIFSRYQFRSVLDCAGNCALRACELDPQMAWRINVDGVQAMLDVIAERDVRLVHLSVDLVFSGNKAGGYLETDLTDPVTVYGKTMVVAEDLVRSQRPQACILRISLPMGVSLNGHAGAIDWIQSRFRKGKPATLYFDEIRTPTYTDCLNELFETMLANQLAGTYHAGGPRRLSLYQIAQVINRVGGYPAELLRGCPRGDAGPVPPRAGNVALESSKLSAALGYDPLSPWPLNDTLVPSDRSWHFERADERDGSPQFLAEVLYSNPSKPHLPRPKFAILAAKQATHTS